MTLHQQTQMAFVAAANNADPQRGVVSAGRGTPVTALKVISNVQILEVGENWHLSTGDRTFTPEDLAAAVAAQDDPAIHTPILKLGHSDKRPGFDGQPAFGKLINLRTENDGMTLVADIAGVPEWMAEAMPTAWPTRSIEGYFGYTTATGKTHPFVVTALALLAEGPAIETLDDLPLALGLVAAETAPQATATRFSGPLAASAPVMASVSYEDVRRAYYDSIEGNPDCCYWWIRELVIDPPQLIVCADDDSLWQVPYTIKGQEITFGTAVAVRVEYVAASAPPTRDGVTVFASREQSRNETPSTEIPEGASMDLTALRTRLGVPADMPDDEVLSLAVTRLPGGDIPAPTDPTVTPPTSQAAPPVTVPAEPATVPTATATDTAPSSLPTPAGTGSGEPPAASPEAPAPAFTAPAGFALVDASMLAELQQNARAGAQVAARVAQDDMDRFMDRVVASGRMHPDPARNPELRQVLATAYRRNPEEAAQIASNLAVVFSTVEAGHAGNGDGVQAAAQESVWNEQDARIFGELNEIRNPQNGRG